MKKAILSLCGILMYSLTFAQGSILTVFSEDGHKFYLILNGQRQNDKAETNIRVEGLTQEFYNCKIIFDDKTLGDVSKSFLPVVDANKSPENVTYKIKAGKDGKQVLRYYSAVAIEPAAPPVRPAGVAVYTFGNTIPVVSETTTTVVQTRSTQTDAANINMNAGGMGMNVNVTIPGDVAGSTTTTTTTTTTSSSSSNVAATPANVATSASAPGCVGYAMAPGDYQSAKESIKEASFEDTKLSTAKQIAGANCLYANQVAEICRLFGFENSKLDFAKYCYKRCIDPQNYFKINPVFDFDASKSELSKYTSTH